MTTTAFIGLLLWLLGSVFLFVLLFRRKLRGNVPTEAQIRAAVEKFDSEDLDRIDQVLKEHGFAIPLDAARVIFAMFAILQKRPAARVDVNEPLFEKVDSLNIIEAELVISSMCETDDEIIEVETRFPQASALHFIEVVAADIGGKNDSGRLE